MKYSRFTQGVSNTWNERKQNFCCSMSVIAVIELRTDIKVIQLSLLPINSDLAEVSNCQSFYET